jgi:hypothetical protein
MIFWVSAPLIDFVVTSITGGFLLEWYGRFFAIIGTIALETYGWEVIEDFYLIVMKVILIRAIASAAASIQKSSGRWTPLALIVMLRVFIALVIST